MQYKIELNDQQLQVLSKALGDQPYVQAAPLIQELNRQLSGQLVQQESTDGGNNQSNTS